MDIAQRFGRNLAHYRKQAGMTQEVLAWHADVHRTQIALLERGKRTPRLDTLVKLAAALSVSPAALVEGIRWVPASAPRGGEFEISDAEDR